MEHGQKKALSGPFRGNCWSPESIAALHESRRYFIGVAGNAEREAVRTRCKSESVHDRPANMLVHELGGSLPGSLYIYTYVSEKRGSTPKMLNSCPGSAGNQTRPNRDPHIADMMDQQSSTSANLLASANPPATTKLTLLQPSTVCQNSS